MDSLENFTSVRSTLIKEGYIFPRSMAPCYNLTLEEEYFTRVQANISNKVNDVFSRLFEYLPNKFIDILYKCGAILAGGSINSIMTNRSIVDHDIYFRSTQDLRLCKDELIRGGLVLKKSVHASNLRILGSKVQLISNSSFMGDPAEIISRFDFTIVQICLDIRTRIFYRSPNFFRDLESRSLVFTGKALNPISTFCRVEKYLRRGYDISEEELGKIVAEIRKKSPDQMRSFGRVSVLDGSY